MGLSFRRERDVRRPISPEPIRWRKTTIRRSACRNRHRQRTFARPIANSRGSTILIFIPTTTRRRRSSRRCRRPSTCSTIRASGRCMTATAVRSRAWGRVVLAVAGRVEAVAAADLSLVRADSPAAVRSIWRVSSAAPAALPTCFAAPAVVVLPAVLAAVPAVAASEPLRLRVRI